MKRKRIEFRGADYEYVNEGGWSMLLQPSPSSWKTTPVLLKIPKRSLAAQRFISGHDTFVDAWFHGKHILRPLYCISLNTTELDQLYQSVDSVRPSKRRVISQDGNHYPMYGSIERNLTLSSEKITVSFELKVKCGLKSYSPFVGFNDVRNGKKDAKMKHEISRYALMQLVKLHEFGKQNETPWGKFERESEYDPSDLCSRDLRRVRNALKNLFHNPQNNLRICLNGRHIYGWNIASMDNLSECLSMLSSTGLFLSPLDYLANVLIHENVLERLESLQALDAFIDVEGCEAIFGRLVEICAGQEQIAIQRIVDSSDLMKVPKQELTIIHRWVKEIDDGIFDRRTYQFGKTPKSDFLLKMLQLTPLQAIKGNVNVNKMKKNSIVTWLKALTENDCILYLQLWLLALGAKDASLIVTLSLSSLSSSWGHSAYLVDIGPKPVSKILKKISRESEIIKKASLALISTNS